MLIRLDRFSMDRNDVADIRTTAQPARGIAAPWWKVVLRRGRITPPVPEPGLTFLRAVRRGEAALPAVLEALDGSEAAPVAAGFDAAVADEPERRWVDDWLHRSHLAYWDSRAAE